MIVLSVGAFWLASQEIADLRQTNGNAEGWVLFGTWCLVGAAVGAALLWIGYRLKGSRMKYLPLFQGIGFALAGALLIWKVFASAGQLVAILGILGGATIFFTVWFAWFLLANRAGK